MIEIRDQFVILQDNIPITFTFDSLDDTDVFITDKQTRQQKTVQGFVLHVTSVNGRNTNNFLRLLSKKAMEILNELNARKVLLTRPIKITKTGSGFNTQYGIEVL